MNRILFALATALLCSLIALNYSSGQQNNSDAVSAALPVYTADGDLLPKAHEVVGRVRVTAGSPTAVRLVGSAMFSSATAYFCTATVSSSVRYVIGVHIINKDGSNFVIEADAAPPGEFVTYRCLGQ